MRRGLRAFGLLMLLALLAEPAVGAFAHQPGDVFRDCQGCPEMVVVPSGSFRMGSTEAERQWAADKVQPRKKVEREKPQHRVVIPGFAVGKYEVTLDEWHACVAEGRCKGAGRGKRPAVNVSWRDAQAYVEWLSEATGETYRLPSEAEWEYACRAGTTTQYSWGDDDPTAAQANVGRNVGKTTEVGSYPPNPWGLYDMHGNVWEWVEDCWNKSYGGAPRDGSAWMSGECNTRVWRGGSRLDDPGYLRCAFRDWGGTDERYTNVGFRVARTLR